MTHQRQSDAKPTLRAVQTALTLSEEVKHTWEQIGSDADAAIGDAQHRFFAFDLSLHANHTAGRGVLDRVGEKVVDDLAESVGIAVDPCCRELDFSPVGLQAADIDTNREASFHRVCKVYA